MLPDEYAKPVVEYLRATRKIYELCMARHVAPDYHLHFEEFRQAFLVLRKLIKLPWTLKVHCILGIYFYFEYFSFLYIWVIFRSLWRVFWALWCHLQIHQWGGDWVHASQPPYDDGEPQSQDYWSPGIKDPWRLVAQNNLSLEFQEHNEE